MSKKPEPQWRTWRTGRLATRVTVNREINVLLLDRECVCAGSTKHQLKFCSETSSECVAGWEGLSKLYGRRVRWRWVRCAVSIRRRSHLIVLQQYSQSGQWQGLVSRMRLPVLKEQGKKTRGRSNHNWDQYTKRITNEMTYIHIFTILITNHPCMVVGSINLCD